MRSKKNGRTLSQRQLRVGEMIKQALGNIFMRGEAKMPNIETSNITVTEVRMSPDLKTAKAFVLPLGGKNANEVIDELNRQLPDTRNTEKMPRLSRQQLMEIYNKAESKIMTDFDTEPKEFDINLNLFDSDTS